jgi:hypothetical protein
VGPRTGLDDMKKRKLLTLPGLELRPLRRSAHSQSLYRLRYFLKTYLGLGFRQHVEESILFLTSLLVYLLSRVG